MDRNQTIGFVLILALLGFYFLYLAPKQEELNQSTTDTVQTTQNQNITKITDTNNFVISPEKDTLTDSLKQTMLFNKFGQFANAATGKKEFYTAENDVLKLTFDSKGGRIYTAELKDYKTYAKTPAILFDGAQNKFYFNLLLNNNIIINTKDLYFENKTEVDSAGNTIVKLQAKVNDDKYIEYVYTLKPNSYLVDFEVHFVNLDDIISRKMTHIELYWKEYVRKLERGEKFEKQYTHPLYKLYKGDVENIKNTKDSTVEQVELKSRWISYKQQYFNTTLLSKNYFSSAQIKCIKLKEDTTNLYIMSSRLTVPFRLEKDVNVPMAFFIGPNKYSLLKKVKIDGTKMQMEKLIPYGKSIIAWVNKLVIIPMFNFLEKYISNFGIIILIMTLVIKLVLFPLTYQSYASSAKMRIIKPELDKALKNIPEKDQMKRQQATMNLYKKAGVKPLGGCLPMLLQFPILVAMYRFFPAAIELRQQTFLWVKDLSSYDAILTWNANIPLLGNHISLFTLLMAVAMVVNTMLTNQNMDSSNPQAKSMKFMMYLMPVMMIVWFNNYSAGLSYYYFLATLIGIIQIYAIRLMMNEEKVLKQMRENMKNPQKAKKSKFQQRLEEIQKQQNQQRKDIGKKK